MKEAVERKKGNGRFGSDESSESGSESYDSVSDGGTIRPSRRKRNRRGWDRRGRGRRRVSDSESESESSDVSSITYYPRTRGRRRDAERRRRREEDRRREEADRRREARRREEESRYRRDRRHRRSLTPSTSPSPSPERTPAPLPKSRPRKRDAFRDSVFSSYGSMKKAAVRLKYVEAKTKLKKQLEEEEGLEKARQDKIREANREIFKDRLKTEEDSAASSASIVLIRDAR